MTDLDLKHKAILFIGLRNALGAARQLATDFRDAMRMQHSEKKRYNNLVEYLNNFSNGMIPTLNPLNTAQKRDLKGYHCDYTASLMSIAMQLAILDAEAIPTFIDQLEWLIDTYSAKNHRTGNSLKITYEIWKNETPLGMGDTPQQAWENTNNWLKARHRELKTNPNKVARFKFKSYKNAKNNL